MFANPQVMAMSATQMVELASKSLAWSTFLLLKNYDILLTQAAVIRSMIASAQTAGTRGSCLVLDEKRGEETKRGLDKSGKSGIMSERGETPVPENASYRGKKLSVACKDGEWKVWHRDVRPIPGADDWFENVWNKFNDRRKIK